MCSVPDNVSLLNIALIFDLTIQVIALNGSWPDHNGPNVRSRFLNETKIGMSLTTYLLLASEVARIMNLDKTLNYIWMLWVKCGLKFHFVGRCLSWKYWNQKWDIIVIECILCGHRFYHHMLLTDWTLYIFLRMIIWFPLSPLALVFTHSWWHSLFQISVQVLSCLHHC